MNAITFAILGALTAAFNVVILRRAVMKVLDASAGVLVSNLVGVFFFLIILIATGQIGNVAGLSWQSYSWLSAAGILHYVVGRSFNYNCIQLAGGNIGNVLSRSSLVVAVVLGISVLNEPLSWELVVGALLVFLGLVAITETPRRDKKGHGLLAGIPRKALFMGLGAGLAWGITPIMVKLGLSGSGSPVVGVFISYTAATILTGVLVWNSRRQVLIDMKGRAVVFFSLAGLLTATAQLLRYAALSVAPASVITPIFSVSPVFVLFLSFLFNRKLEVFNKAVIIGTIAVVVGGILLA